jgi:transcriptional regulator with XRE-family HTH domain
MPPLAQKSWKMPGSVLRCAEGVQIRRKGVLMGRQRWVRLGKQIRVYRERSGLSQEELGERIKLSPTMLSAMERGARGIKRSHMEQIDSALGTRDLLTQAWDRTEGSGLPPWYRGAAELEREASEIQEYQPMVVPGLLQTEDYARHLIRVGLPNETPSGIDRLVHGRMQRQELLEAESPPRLLYVMDEATLRRPFGGRDLMCRQLTHLLEVSQKPHVMIHIVPFDTADHPGLSNGFALISVPAKGSILYIETRRIGTPTADADAVEDYVRLFGDLRGAALPRDTSHRLISQVLGEL